jgi:DNA polymerase III delta subunit
MLYLFYGSNTSQSGDKAHALVNSLRAKRPDASFVRIDADNWSASLVEEHLGGQGLFSNKYIVFLDRVTEDAGAKESIADFIPALNESTNIFIVLEGKLNAELKKAFERSSEKIVVSDEPASSKAKTTEFNIFALGDALGARDAFKSWMIYRQAVESSIEAESILGTLFWQAKSIALSADAKTAGEAGLSPFVYGKSKKYAGNYSKDEIGTLIMDLITVYHDGHRGLNDIELSIESLLLNCGK